MQSSVCGLVGACLTLIALQAPSRAVAQEEATRITIVNPESAAAKPVAESDRPSKASSIVYFAQVEANASVTGSFGVKKVEALGDFYKVTFKQDVSKCALNVTPNAGVLQRYVATLDGGAAQHIYLMNTAGVLSKTAFSVTATCRD